jgi:hypothetical protein
MSYHVFFAFLSKSGKFARQHFSKRVFYALKTTKSGIAALELKIIFSYLSVTYQFARFVLNRRNLLAPATIFIYPA